MTRTLTVDDWPLAALFNLPPRARVVVAGSYEGAVIKLLTELYNCSRVLGYDPQHWACERARDLLSATPEAEIYSVGLSNRNHTTDVYEWGTDAASIHRRTREAATGFFVDADYEFRLRAIGHFDLAVFNMEGEEYELLPYLDNTGWIKRTNRLVVQFHRGLGNDGGHDRLVAHLDGMYPHRLDLAPSWLYWSVEPIPRPWEDT